MPGADADVFLTEEAYASLCVSARWLQRAPSVAARHGPGGDAPSAPLSLPADDAPPQPSVAAPGGHSALTWEEHAWYLRACQPDAEARLTPDELDRLRRLAGVVAAEQAAYARERATSGADAEALRFYDPAVAEQVETTLAARRRRTQQLPGLFTLQGEVHLDADAPPPALRHQRLLETRGCSQLLRNLPPGTHIPTHGEAVADSGGKKAVSVSADATCAALAAAEGARVVLSSGAFRCLANTLHEQEWELPVTVRAGYGFSAGSVPPLVFVDSPTLPAALSLRAKNELFYKHAVLRLAMKSAARSHEQPTQEHQYRLWCLGQTKLLVRCREHALLPSQTPGGAATSAVVRAKLEYAPQRGWEEVTAAERARWWSALILRPGATLLVCRVGVLDSALLAVERRDIAAVLDDSTEPGTRFQPSHALSQVHQALLYLERLPPGAYLLRRTRHSAHLECLHAVADASAADAAVSDLRPRRAAAGATAAEQLGFVPIRWQPAQPGAVQVPFTLPPVGLPSAVPRRKARQQWMLGAGGSPPKARERPAKQPAAGAAVRHASVRYCHAFAEGRACRLGERCAFPHISMAEVERLAAAREPVAAAQDTGGSSYLAQLHEYVAKRQRTEP